MNEEDSVKELARILGGDKITSSIMESAREMKEMAKSEIIILVWKKKKPHILETDTEKYPFLFI